MIQDTSLSGGVSLPACNGVAPPRPIGRRSVLAGVAAGVIAAPYVARGQARSVKVGMQSILSGPIALLGTSQRNAVSLEVERINAAGGLAGRPIELVVRDSRGQPQEAARVARELINSDGVEILIDAEASSGAFAVQEVIRDLGTLCLHTASETSSLTADPKLRVPSAFRCARQGVHDAIVGGSYAARVATAAKLTRWATCSPDYAYGRDVTKQYISWIKHFMPDLEVVTEAWPKLGQPDFTEVITKLLQARPQAVFSLLYAGDLSAFVNQASVYALFGQTSLFTPNMGDYPVLAAIKTLPAGIRTGDRYLETFPDTPANKAWGEAYRARFKDLPTNWAWQAATAVRFLEAAAKKAGTLETKPMAAALRGLKIESPFGSDGTVTMREDQTLVGYAIGWGVSQTAAPYIVDIQAGDWGQIFELEAEWKKSQGYV
jgi:branched-chain amino acid transport system substrate-binding protein